MFRKSLFCATMMVIVALAVASTGGGKKRSSSSPIAAFTPIGPSGNFVLASNPVYAGSQIFSSKSDKSMTLYNSLITYQKGNTTYVVPSRVKINSSNLSFKSNLNVVDLKIRLCK